MAIRPSRTTGWTALAALAALMALFVIARAARADAPVSAQEVAEELTCQCGCGLTVANCNHPQCEFSTPVRDQIATMIGRGESGPEIVAFFRHKYGEKILSAPTTQGFNLLAWVMPFAALIAGGAIIFLAVSRWRGGRPPSSPESSAPAYDDELRRRLRRDLMEKL